MVTLRLTIMEVQELRLWAHEYKQRQEEVGFKWQEDQEKLSEKLNLAVGKDKNGEPLSSKEMQGAEKRID